jgi:uncharacterized membrane protein YhaH (DUF805 family)
MHKLGALLSFAGRTSRLSYWRWLLLLSVTIATLYVLAVFIVMGGFPGSRLIAAVLLAAMVMLLWPVLAVSVRRLHDRSKTGWWMLVFNIFPYVAELGVAQTLKVGGVWVLAGLVLVLTVLVVVVWGWIEFGFLRGTRGPNRFGPEPSRI